jgi:hypothetical protein
MVDLQQSERRLRTAISAGDHASVECAVAAFSDAARAGLEALPASDPRRRELALHILATLDWSHLMLATQRSVFRQQLSEVTRLRLFLDRQVL